VQNTITVGQIYGLLVLLAALAYCFHQRRQPVAAAIAIGLLVAVKPTMAFLLPFLWLAHHRRIAWVATGVTCIASALPVLFYGPGIYTQWVAALLGDMHWIGSTDIAPIAIFPAMVILMTGLFWLAESGSRSHGGSGRNFPASPIAAARRSAQASFAPRLHGTSIFSLLRRCTSHAAGAY
jgi:hypothetical protein